jgi:hypothetical protein
MLNLQDTNLETIVLLLAGIAVVIILAGWHIKDSAFDVSQIVTNADGTFSLSKFGQLVSMLVSTWIIIYQTRHGLLTEFLFSGYMISWAGANAFHKYLESKKTDTTP